MRAESFFSREEKENNKKERGIAFRPELDYTSSISVENFRRKS